MVSFGFSFVVLEVVWRVWIVPLTGEQLNTAYVPSPYPGVSFVRRPGAQIYDFGKKMRINSVGLRDRKYPGKKKQDVFRVLVVGDSITESAGVPLEKTYTTVLENELNRQSSEQGGQTRFQVINAGHEGYTGLQELSYLKYYGLKFDPDMVLVQYFFNDPLPIARLSGTNPDTGFIAWWIPIKNFIKHNSVLSFWMMKKYYHWRAATKEMAEEEKGLWLRGFIKSCEKMYDTKGSYWPSFVRVLEGFKALSEKEGLPILFLIFPINEELTDDHPYLPYYHQVEKELERLRIPYFDLFNVYRGHEEKTLWLHGTDFHLNELSSRLAGEAIAQILSQDNRIPFAEQSLE